MSKHAFTYGFNPAIYFRKGKGAKTKLSFLFSKHWSYSKNVDEGKEKENHDTC